MYNPSSSRLSAASMAISSEHMLAAAASSMMIALSSSHKLLANKLSEESRVVYSSPKKDKRYSLSLYDAGTIVLSLVVVWSVVTTAVFALANYSTSSIEYNSSSSEQYWRLP